MKGLSITMVGGVVIALVGVTVLIGVYSQSTGGMGKLFCSVYQGTKYSIPGQDAPAPKNCVSGSNENRYEAREFQSVNEAELLISREVIQCWEKFKGYKDEEKLCKGWNIVSIPSAVKEGGITRKMKENDLCPRVIQNSMLENGGGPVCGSENQLIFEKPEIREGSLLLIKYDIVDGKEVVKLS